MPSFRACVFTAAFVRFNATAIASAVSPAFHIAHRARVSLAPQGLRPIIVYPPVSPQAPARVAAVSTLWFRSAPRRYKARPKGGESSRAAPPIPADKARRRADDEGNGHNLRRDAVRVAGADHLRPRFGNQSAGATAPPVALSIAAIASQDGFCSPLESREMDDCARPVFLASARQSPRCCARYSCRVTCSLQNLPAQSFREAF